MKKKRVAITSIFLITLLIQACNRRETMPASPADNIIPARFAIVLPSSISSFSNVNASRFGARTEVLGDTFNGNKIYHNLRQYIKLGESAGAVVQYVMNSVRTRNPSKPQSFTIASGVGAELHRIIIDKMQEFEGKTFDYGLTVAGVSSGVVNTLSGMKCYWNKNEGYRVALVNLAHMSTNQLSTRKGILRIEYSNTPAVRFTETMLVQANGLDSSSGNFVSKLKMFVGILPGDSLMEMTGNTYHQDFTVAGLNASLPGLHLAEINFAYRAKAAQKRNIAVAEVALVPASVTDSIGLFEQYRVKDILTGKFAEVYPQYTSTDFLNMDPPALYVRDLGYSASTTVAGFTIGFKDLSGLIPFAPASISNLHLEY